METGGRIFLLHELVSREAFPSSPLVQSAEVRDVGSTPPVGLSLTSLFLAQFLYRSCEWVLSILKQGGSPALPCVLG